MGFAYDNSITLPNNKTDGGAPSVPTEAVASDWNLHVNATTDLRSAVQGGDYHGLRDMSGGVPAASPSGGVRRISNGGVAYTSQDGRGYRQDFFDRCVTEFGTLSSSSGDAATNDTTIAAAIAWAYTELNTNTRQPRLLFPIMDIPISATIVPKGNTAGAPILQGAVIGNSFNLKCSRFQWYGASGGQMLQTEAFNKGQIVDLAFDARSLAKGGVNISGTTFADPMVLAAASGWAVRRCNVSNLKKNTVGSDAFSWSTDTSLTGGSTMQSSEGLFEHCVVNGEAVLNNMELGNMKAAAFKNRAGGNAKNTTIICPTVSYCDVAFDLTLDSGYTNVMGGSFGECRYLAKHNDSQLTIWGADQECSSNLGQAYALYGGTSGAGSADMRGCQIFVNAGASADIVNYSGTLFIRGGTWSNTGNSFWLRVNVTSAQNGSVESRGVCYRGSGASTSRPFAPFRDGSGNDMAPVAGLYGGINPLNISSKGDYDDIGDSGGFLKLTEFDSSSAVIYQHRYNGPVQLSYSSTTSTPTTLGNATVWDVDATGGSATVNLPSAATSNSGRIYLVSKKDSTANTVTVNGKVLAKQYDALLICSTGSAWVNVSLGAGVQFFSGQKTFTAPILYSSTNSISAHAGGGQGSATALSTEVNYVTTVASGGDSVKLPAAAAGERIVVWNLGANAMDIFPASGEAIDALGANNAYSLAATTAREFWGQAASTWRSK